MPNLKTTFAITCVLSSALMLSACNKDKEPTAKQEQQSSASNDAIGQLNQTPIKQFPATADDGHDIAILEDYDNRFTDMSDSMEIELAKMKEANTLTPEFEQQRQKDNVKSALAMLKDLELKTEQGRYIQGLLYDYWEQQAKVLEQGNVSNQTNANKQVNHLNEYLHAQSQLHHWRNAQTPETKMQAE
ncbi:hypothetical protein MMP65_02485 [Acinetobacter sp. ANC 3926]|uniref:Uncharacterized protein n=1 Tax=Acinetobacter genomosp. 15BJ TaxID=106651 RepID=R9B6S2_9GAMM|nr:hypothetical protein [Acinetobacter genomosp. 15BJ]EOR10112.1 hypothetical protein F896_00232 [Acinetobacter genomosp. 15BJ]MCH7290335.1 hypothetical protein [Acinetobacter genomosp. 15BJ]